MCDVPIQKARSPRDEAQITIPIIARTLNRQKRRHKLNEMVENLRKIVDQSSVKRSTRLLKISIDSTKYRSIADNFSVDSTFREIGRLDRSIRSVPGTNPYVTHVWPIWPMVDPYQPYMTHILPIYDPYMIHVWLMQCTAHMTHIWPTVDSCMTHITHGWPIWVSDPYRPCMTHRMCHSWHVR